MERGFPPHTRIARVHLATTFPCSTLRFHRCTESPTHSLFTRPLSGGLRMKPDHTTVHPDARETIAYAELLRLAHEEGLKSIATSLVLQPSEGNGRLAIVKAAVET